MKSFILFLLSISLAACSPKEKSDIENQSSNGKTINCKDKDIPENAHWKETNATSVKECKWECNDSHSLYEGVCYIKSKACTNAENNIASETQTYIPETAGEYEACASNLTKVPTVSINLTSIHLLDSTPGTFATLTGKCSERNQAVNLHLAGVAPSSQPTCSNTGQWTKKIEITSLPTGSISITADHASSGGANANQARGTFPKSKPTVSISHTPMQRSNRGTILTLTGKCSERNQSVTLAVAGTAPSSQPTCSTTGQWTKKIDVTSLPAGSISITADHESSGGTSARQAIMSISKTIPTTSIARHSFGQEITMTYILLEGKCSGKNQPVSLNLTLGGVTLSSQPTCSNTGQWTKKIDITSFSTGTISFTVDHENANGDSAPQLVESFSKLTPSFSVVSAAFARGASGTYYVALEGKCSEKNQPVSLQLAGVALSSQPTCDTNGKWKKLVTVTKFSIGPISITGDHANAGGTRNAPRITTIHTKTVPSVSISQYNFTRNTKGNQNLSLKGECSEKNRPVTATITISNKSVTATPSCDSKGEWKITFDITKASIGSIPVTADHESATKVKAHQAQITVSKSTPTVSISNHTLSSQNNVEMALAGACSEAGQPILLKLTGGIYNLVPPSPICNSQNYWTTIINITKLPLGTISITADHETTDGTKAMQAQYSFDKENPTIDVTLFEIKFRINKSFFLISGDCSDKGREVIIRIGGKAPTNPVICGNLLQWSAVIDGTSVPTGATSITLQHSHSNTKVVNVSSSFIKPQSTVSIINRAPDKERTGVLKVHGACSESGQKVTVSIGGTSPSTQPTCTSGAWETEVDFGSDSDIPTGAVAITADHASSNPSIVAAKQAKNVLDQLYLSYGIHTCSSSFRLYN